MCNGTLKAAHSVHIQIHIVSGVCLQCLLVHSVLVFRSYPICHIVNTATEIHLI